jgi:hypothetical protein
MLLGEQNDVPYRAAVVHSPYKNRLQLSTVAFELVVNINYDNAGVQ